jgi:hypothetical protein
MSEEKNHYHSITHKDIRSTIELLYLEYENIVDSNKIAKLKDVVVNIQILAHQLKQSKDMVGLKNYMLKKLNQSMI